MSQAMQQPAQPIFMPPPTKEDMRADHDALPHSLDIISEFLGQVRVPEELFDPNGEWNNGYRVVMALRGGFDKSWNAGALKISRRPTANGPVEMTVARSLITEWWVFHCLTTATLTCSADQFATPGKWVVNSVTVDRDGKALNYTKTEVAGEVEGSIVRYAPGKRTVRLGRHFSSNWSLFDAVQRLPFEGTPVSFDLLEDLEKIRRGHCIQYSGSIETALGGRTMRLHSFTHTGEGILGSTYWLDDKHRLLMAIGGLMAFIYDPNATVIEEKL